jgi:hypothetical protein
MQLLDLNTATPWGIASLYGKLKALVREFKPDVVNCHRGESYLLWGLLKKELGGFRLIRTRGDQRLPKANLINRWLHNDVSDAVITTNSPMTRHFQNVFHVPANKLHQILGGVGHADFPPRPGRPRPHPGGAGDTRTEISWSACWAASTGSRASTS